MGLQRVDTTEWLNWNEMKMYSNYIILDYFPKTIIYLFIFTYNIVLVLPYIDMNLPWVNMCSPSWNSLPPPSLYYPSGHPSAPALSTLSHASNLDWWSVSHMIIYMFQCYSLKSSHPHPLPQSPKDCSIHLCLFCYKDHFLNKSLQICILRVP